jgi:tetratricopeptide (TPR) repeat protein
LAQVLFQQGWALERAGRAAAAAEQYARALKQDRQCVDALIQLGLLRFHEGRAEEGVELVRRATKANPRIAAAHQALGAMLFAVRRFDQALAAFERVLALGPATAETLSSRADCLGELGRAEEALASYDTAIALKPHLAEAHNNRGNALRRLGRLDQALAAYRQATALSPNAASHLFNSATVLFALGRFQEAFAAYDEAIAQGPGFAPAHFGRGAALFALEDSEGALESYSRTISLDPQNAQAWAHLARTLGVLGRSAQAETAARRAVGLDPANPEAWCVLASLKRFGPGDPDLERMEAALAKPEVGQADPEGRLNLEFALGRAWLEAGEAGRAFAHLDQANRLERSRLDFDIDAYLATLDAMAGAIDAETIDRLAGAGDPSDQPIFIIGMPRSGTTLVEQILASHPQVQGAGELTLVDRLARRLPGAGEGLAEALLPDIMAALGAEYASRARALAPGAARLIDKLPGNFAYAGLIHLMLPNARIIHCIRDPLDTCLSCYETRFAKGNPYAYDLRELGRRYLGYAQLMAHWRRLLPPDRFIEVRYEDVVADLEGQARRLLGVCGLGWDEACLEFHSTRREVWTASSSQVRRPLYASSIGRGQACAAYLGPLIEVLEKGEANEATVAA